MKTLFEEEDFIKRLKMSVSEAWKIFQLKVGNGMIKINKEASMQLQYANVLQNLIPLIICKDDEKVEIELEKTAKLKDKYTEIDVFVVGEKNNKPCKIAIEMKCYKEKSSSEGKRGATDIFMKDVYVDIQNLENYISNGICDYTVFLAMTDFSGLVNPKKKKGDAKCWAYEISDGFLLSPQKINIPIGGKPQDITITNEYTFKWIERGGYYFLELKTMKIYAIYAEMVEEPICYAEAEDINDLVNIMHERSKKGEPYRMFPGWFPVEISRKEMVQNIAYINKGIINK